MRKTFFYILSFCLLVFMACDKKGSKGGIGGSTSNTTKKGVTLDPNKNVFPLSIQKGGSFRSLDQIRVEALGIIKHRNLKEPETLSMLTYAYWTPEFVYNAGSISKPDDYQNYWLKFGDDFRYAYGVGKETTGGGRYHFRISDKSLHMLDNDVEQEPKSWIVNHNANVIALVGTHDYKVNNGMQIKMIPMDQNPL